MVLPGDRVGATATHRAGEHTTVCGEHIYSTVIGHVAVSNSTLSVTPQTTRSAMPKQGETVLARVTKVTPRFAGVDIIGVVCSTPPTTPPTTLPTASTIVKLPIPHKATIRSHDIYAVEERDAPGVYDSFRPTDLLLAQVIGVGDTSTGLLLSTGVNSRLGVVLARSVAGGGLVGVAWNEMVCERTGLTERRKVAKPV